MTETKDASASTSISGTPVDHKTYYSRIRESDIRQVAIDLGIKITSEAGGVLNCDCPRHSSASHKSLHITPSTQAWFCFGCQVGGDVIQLVEFHQSGVVTKNVRGEMPETHRKARDWLGVRQGLPPLSQISMTDEQVEQLRTRYQKEERLYGCLTCLCEFYHQKLVEDPEVLSQFQANYAISLETIQNLKIGYSIVAGAARHLYDNGYTYDDMIECGAFKSNYQDKPVPRFKFRYTFPYWNNGRVIYLAGRETSKTPKPERTSSENEHHSKYYKLPTRNDDPKGNRQAISPIITNRILWNEHILDTNPPFVIFSEGMTDAISALDRDFPVISPITTYIANDDLERVIKKLKRLKCPVYICLDNELSKVGNEAAIKMAELFEYHGIEPPKIVTLSLTPEQIEARKIIADLFAISDDMTKKQIADAVNRLPEADKTEFKRLADTAKQDINSYFKSGFTADDFRTLLSEAPTCRGLIIQKRRERIVQKDFSVLEDREFLRAMAEAKTKDIATYAEVSELIKKNKGWGIHIKDGIKTLRDDPGRSPFIRKQEKKEVSKTLEEIGVSCPEGCGLCTIPIGYEFTDHGIDRCKGTANMLKRDLVSPVPVLVKRRVKDITTDLISLEFLFYEKERGWKSIVAPRETVLTPSKIMRLANHGLWVKHDTANYLTGYIHDYESENNELLATDDVTCQLGWVEPSMKTFLYGKQCIGDACIQFIPPDVGDNQIADSLESAGSLERWLAMAEKILTNYPNIAILVYSALAAPLLRILGANTFIVDVSAPTSSGKSIAVRFAMSAFGNPTHLTRSWNCTQVGLERIATTQKDFPLALDDTKTGNARKFADMAYQITNEVGRNRGSKTGSAATLHWKTVLISSGEASLSEYIVEGGARSRVFPLRGYPFFKTNQATRKLVAEIDSISAQNYGLIGPAWVKFLHDNRDKWQGWRTEYETENLELSNDESGPAGRFINVRTAVTFAARLLHSSGIFPWEFIDPFESVNTAEDSLNAVTVWEDIGKDIKEADIGLRALQDIWSWCVQHKESFLGHHEQYVVTRGGSSELIEKTPHGGWVGKWDDDDNWTGIAIQPPALETALQEIGYPDAKAVKTAWKQNGYLKISGRGYDWPVKMFGKVVKMIFITREAIEQHAIGDISGIDDDENVNSREEQTVRGEGSSLGENVINLDQAKLEKYLKRQDREYAKIQAEEIPE